MIGRALLIAALALPALARAESPASAPAWPAKCAERLEQAKTAFVKRHPRFHAATVSTEPARAAFNYEAGPTQYAAEASALRGEDRAWYNPCGEGCADLIGQRRAHDRLAAYYVFVGEDAVSRDFERIFKPALDDCLAY